MRRSGCFPSPRKRWRKNNLGIIPAAMHRPLLFAFLLSFTTVHAGDPVRALIDHARKHPAGDVPCSFARTDYDTDTRKLPVGVFDSGIGGLTVLNAILNADAFHNDNLKPGADGVRDFASERFIYLGDQANM